MSQASSRQLDDPTELPVYKEEFRSWENDCGQEFSWEAEPASLGADPVASALIETSLRFV